MRHSTITLTLDIYGHLAEGEELAERQVAGPTATPDILKANGTMPNHRDTSQNLLTMR
jgi:hypothetical protein